MHTDQATSTTTQSTHTFHPKHKSTLAHSTIPPTPPTAHQLQLQIHPRSGLATSNSDWSHLCYTPVKFQKGATDTPVLPWLHWGVMWPLLRSISASPMYAISVPRYTKTPQFAQTEVWLYNPLCKIVHISAFFSKSSDYYRPEAQVVLYLICLLSVDFSPLV